MNSTSRVIGSHSKGMRQMAILLGAVVAIGGIVPASGTTYYSGKGDSTTGSTLSKIVKWYTDEGLTTLADPQPKPTANDDNPKEPTPCV